VSGTFRFVHAADLHLDTPFQGIAGPAPGVAQALQEASLQAWDNVVALTIEREAAFLLIAGDIYDGADRGMRAQLRFLAGLKRLDEAGIRSFIVHGNHDPLDGWSAIEKWPAGVKVFGPDGSLNIGLLHTNVGGNAEYASYAPCSLSDLEAAGMDYWALGHIHKQQYLREGGPWVAYSGDVQGRSPKPSETGAKGVLVAEVSGSSIGPVTFEPVDIGDVVDVPSLSSRIIDLVDETRGANAERSLLVRVVLQGRGAVADDIRHGAALDDVVGDLRASYDGLDPFVWIESLKDQSRGALDLDALRARDDFNAELLRLYDRLAADPEAGEAFVKTAAAKLDSSGQVEKAVHDLDAQAPEEALIEALYLALDGLERKADS
jgi:DNA repair exonuclease SbcCD nuclease subunit